MLPLVLLKQVSHQMVQRGHRPLMDVHIVHTRRKSNYHAPPFHRYNKPQTPVYEEPLPPPPSYGAPPAYEEPVYEVDPPLPMKGHHMELLQLIKNQCTRSFLRPLPSKSPILHHRMELLQSQPTRSPFLHPRMEHLLLLHMMSPYPHLPPTALPQWMSPCLPPLLATGLLLLSP